MAMTGQNAFEQRLLLEPCHKIESGLGGALLYASVAPLFRSLEIGVVLAGYLQRHASQIGTQAFGLLQPQLALLGSVERHMNHQYDGQSFLNLFHDKLVLLLRYLIVAVIQGYEVESVYHTRGAGEVVGVGCLHFVKRCGPIGGVFKRLAHILGIFVVSGCHKPICLLEMGCHHVQVGF